MKVTLCPSGNDSLFEPSATFSDRKNTLFLVFIIKKILGRKTKNKKNRKTCNLLKLLYFCNSFNNKKHLVFFEAKTENDYTKNRGANEELTDIRINSAISFLRVSTEWKIQSDQGAN